MLINTVVLFLRDVLPVFILMSLLLAASEYLQVRLRWLFFCLPFGLLGAVVLINQIGLISEWFDGAGMEVMLFSLHFCIYLLSVGYAFLQQAGARYTAKLALCSAVMMTLVFWVCGANFLVFFMGYWSQTNAAQALVLGGVLGLGINLSVATLLFFAAIWMMNRFGVFVQLLMLLVFSAGQAAQATHLLVQIDWLSQTAPLWDSSDGIADNSVIGHFLRSLIGYEAAPNLYQVIFYAGGLLFPVTGLYLFNRYQHRTTLVMEVRQ
ncbi:hypothetical protein [Neptunicella sp. SCSIO 80796]|uniref:hypothetical protein n=1 Tax=Neptunicella plasticusilytica TaxID=3117012 RepID=UPI003A4DAFFC